MTVSISNEVIKTIINKPAYDEIFNHNIPHPLTDLQLFTKGQPFEIFDEYRLNAPIHFHEPAEYDIDPGFWSLTRYEDIQYVSMNLAMDIINDYLIL